MSFFVVIILGLGLVWIIDKRFFNRALKPKINLLSLVELIPVSLAMGIGLFVLMGLIMERVVGFLT